MQEYLKGIRNPGSRKKNPSHRGFEVKHVSVVGILATVTEMDSGIVAIFAIPRYPAGLYRQLLSAYYGSHSTPSEYRSALMLYFPPNINTYKSWHSSNCCGTFFPTQPYTKVVHNTFPLNSTEPTKPHKIVRSPTAQDVKNTPSTHSPQSTKGPQQQ